MHAGVKNRGGGGGGGGGRRERVAPFNIILYSRRGSFVLGIITTQIFKHLPGLIMGRLYSAEWNDGMEWNGIVE